MVAAIVLTALPEIVRRVAVTQLARITGRSVSIEDVDLNLFAGRVALKRFRLGQRGSTATALGFDGVEVRFAPAALLRRHIRLFDLALTAPTIRATRTGPAEFDFADLLALIPPTDPARPSRWVVSLDGLRVTHGTIIVRDLVTPPAGEWRIDGLTVRAAGLSTRGSAPPGWLELDARLNGAAVGLKASSVRLEPGAVVAQVSVDRLALAKLAPYLPPALPAAPAAGTLSLALGVSVERGNQALRRGVLSGEATVDGVDLVSGGDTKPFATLAHLRVRIGEADLLRRVVTIRSVEAHGFELRLERDAAGRIRLPAAPAAAAGSPAPPSLQGAPHERRAPDSGGVRVRIERVALVSGRVSVKDGAVSPPRVWRLDDLAIDGHGLSTEPTDPPGGLSLLARLRQEGAGGRPASVSIRADEVRLVPPSGSLLASLARFELAQVDAYVPRALGIAARGGTADVALRIAFEHGSTGLRRGVVAGEMRVDKLALAHRADSRPLVEVSRLSAILAKADLLTREVRLGSVDVDGLRLHAIREPQGAIDLLALTRPRAAAAGRPPAAGSMPAAVGPSPRVTLDQVALRNATLIFTDQALATPTTLAATDLAAVLRHLTWPVAGPVALETAMTLPGGGRLEVKGDVRLLPFAGEFAMSLRGGSIEPFQGYLPFKARLAGRFNGDNRSSVKIDGGVVTATARGRDWVDHFEVRAPGEETPVVRVERMELSGIDFGWPTHARAERFTLTRPDIQVVREEDGSINLRTLFEPDRSTPATAATSNDGASAPARPTPAEGPAPSAPASSDGVVGAPANPHSDHPLPGDGQPPFPVEIAAIVVDDGYARFLDRGTRPAYSESFSRLAVSVEGLSTIPGRRARLQAQAVVGGGAALDLGGEIAPLGDRFADLSGELRDFSLASVNPYADRLISWIVRRGRLGFKVHYRIERDRLTAQNDVVVANLEVTPSKGSDEVKRRIGLPLGLIVALIKDSNGEFRTSIPVSGTLGDPSFSWSDAIWTAVKNVVVNVVTSPFKLIGKVFTGGDRIESLAVEPLPFAPGSADITPETARALTGIGDFLRRSPFVNLVLTPVGTARDIEAVKAQEVTARLQRLQRERGLPDFAAAVGTEFRERFPGAAPPEPAETQLARLVEHEPRPGARVAELLARRLAAARDGLAKTEGIPPERFSAGDATQADDAPGEGRVEFRIAE